MGACVVAFAGLARAQDAANIAIPVADATPDSLTDDQVVAAINKGVDWLFAQQQNGAWEQIIYDHDGRRCTGTGMAVWSLVHVGESLHEDARLRRTSKELKGAVDVLKGMDTDLTYMRSMQVMALSQIYGDPKHGNPAVGAALRTVGDKLVAQMSSGGGYVYWFKESPDMVKQNHWDNSATQLATLAAWSMAECRVEIPTSYWTTLDKYWRAHQNADGGWGYSSAKDQETYVTMTAAAVASLFILQEQTDRDIRLVSKPDKAIDDGLTWLDKNFVPGNAFDLNLPATPYWALFSLERVTLATGKKYVGGHDWYREGAAALLRKQQADGSWGPVYGFHDGNNGIVPTCLAITFLARGRNPIAFNKLEYPGNTWNARPRDAAYETKWMAGNFERAINWQVVNLTSDPQEWLDAPVLLITGSQDPKFSAADLAKIRAFIEAGGMVFSTADGANPTYTKAMLDYAGKVVGNKYEPRELPDDHPVFSSWQRLKSPMKLFGLSNGARELWIHAPGDVGRAWQQRAYASADQFTIGANVFFYAAGNRESLSPRLKALKVADAGAPGNRVSVAQVEYPGNWDPEPGAWKRLAKIMRRDAVADLDLQQTKTADLDATKTPVAHLTGTSAFTVPEDDVKKLRAYLDAGGTLVIDCCGGRDEFNSSAAALIKSLYPGTAAAPVDDAVLAGDYTGGTKVDDVMYRKAALLKRGGGHKANILGVKQGNRYTILYAPEDITSGLLGTNTAGIVGYMPDSALAIARDLVMFAASAKK